MLSYIMLLLYTLCAENLKISFYFKKDNKEQNIYVSNGPIFRHFVYT